MAILNYIAAGSPLCFKATKKCSRVKESYPMCWRAIAVLTSDGAAIRSRNTKRAWLTATSKFTPLFTTVSHYLEIAIRQ